MTNPKERQAISLAALKRNLSEPRLETYRLDPGESAQALIGRYRWNIALCMSFYPVVQQLEVALRNNLHRAIAGRFGVETWYDLSPSVLTQREQDAIVQAKDELRKQGKPDEPGRVVAELTFGFWTSLLSREYERRLWPHLLAATFPFVPRRMRTRNDLSGRFQQVRRLRNRIFHHEPIFKLKLPQLYIDVNEAISWLAPSLLQLLPIGDGFPDVYARGSAPYELSIA